MGVVVFTAGRVCKFININALWSPLRNFEMVEFDKNVLEMYILLNIVIIVEVKYSV